MKRSLLVLLFPAFLVGCEDAEKDAKMSVGPSAKKELTLSSVRDLPKGPGASSGPGALPAGPVLSKEDASHKRLLPKTEATQPLLAQASKPIVQSPTSGVRETKPEMPTVSASSPTERTEKEKRKQVRKAGRQTEKAIPQASPKSVGTVPDELLKLPSTEKERGPCLKMLDERPSALREEYVQKYGEEPFLIFVRSENRYYTYVHTTRIYWKPAERCWRFGAP